MQESPDFSRAVTVIDIIASRSLSGSVTPSCAGSGAENSRRYRTSSIRTPHRRPENHSPIASREISDDSVVRVVGSPELAVEVVVDPDVDRLVEVHPATLASAAALRTARLFMSVTPR
ncbi:hypothetical protein [Halocalculus aciditolerans]|uniref:Uncharacterized protein n=1 Tax=Halocalculus aciditolerans TaxID=1383812 RepID=A0A830FH12_9EURY|nr:hypothetical protein [Halocalculus aciditolerans]GGL73626.1 hypothetical protein GCM10009039_34640 [Halocalculus aciditolerans]